MRSVPGVAAAMAERESEIAVDRHPQPHAVVRCLPTGLRPRVSGPLAHARKIRALREFAHGCALDGPRLSIIARRPRRQQVCDPFCIIDGARLNSSHGPKRAMAERRFETPRIVLPAITECAAFAGRLIGEEAG